MVPQKRTKGEYKMAEIHQQRWRTATKTPNIPLFSCFSEWRAVCNREGGRSYEKQIVRSSIIGRKLVVRRARRGCRSRHWRATAGSSRCRPGRAGSRIRLGRWLLVSGWWALGLARGLLGPPGLCGCSLVWPALLRWPVLPRLLAPLGKPAAAHGATLLNATGHRVFPA
jgi:hypothetical protein